MSTLAKSILFILGLLSAHTLVAQKQVIPLTEVLAILEEKYNCQFSYADAAVKDHVIEIPNSSSLPEALEQLEKKTLFDFMPLNNGILVLSKKAEVKEKCFTITDALTNQPLTNITAKSRFQEVKSDANGRITVDVTDKGTSITIFSESYVQRTINSKNYPNVDCYEIKLTQRLETLEPVYLQQYVTKGINKNIDGSVAIAFDDFVVLPGLIENDVLFSLQALPGIQSINENISFLNIRGGTNDQNLILWDGIKMYQNGHFFGLISAFNPSITQHARITRNGTAASLGDGVSGTIEMFTDPERNKKFDAEAGINMISADAFVDIPLGELASVQVAGRKSLNSLWSSPTYQAYFEKAFQNTEVLRVPDAGEEISETDFSFYDASFRLLLDLSPKDKLRLNFVSFSSAISFFERYNGDLQQDPYALNSSLSQQTLASGLWYERKWNNRLRTEAQIYGNRYELESVNGDLQNNQTLIQQNDIEEGAITLQADYKLFSKIAVTGGIELTETGVTNLQQIDVPNFIRKEKKVMRSAHGFTSVTYKNGNTTYLEVGVRSNYYDKFNTLRWEPRLRFNQRFLEYFSVELLGELKSQNTSQIIDLQKDFLGVENRRWVLSEPGTTPLLRSKQLSAGISYSRNGFLINVEPFFKEVDGITAQSQGFQNQFENTSAVGNYVVKGVDLLLNKSYHDFSFWTNYSYADNKYTFKSLSPMVFHNNLDITHTLSTGINYSWKNFKFASGLNWHTGRPFTPLNQENPIEDGTIQFGFPNSARIRDYVRVDFSAIYNFNIGKSVNALAGLSLWNVLNRENHIRTFFRLDDSDSVQSINETALPFTPNAVLRVFF